jgi:3-hydroxyacyl-CoA dehydrogenase
MDDPAVMEIVEATCAELGINRRTISDEEIIDRLTLALANEGAKILEDGIAQRASDIDVVYCYGYGFPRFKGGPMHNLEAVGIPRAVARMEEFASKLSAQNWQPAKTLQELSTNGGKLADV